MPQAIIQIGFDAQQTNRQAAEVYAAIKKVLEVARELDGIKINISDWSAGIRDFKTNVDAAATSQTKLRGSIDQSNKSIIDQAKIRKANADAEKAEFNAQTAKIKQNTAEIASEEKLAKAKEKTAQAERDKTYVQNVPFTLHTNADEAAGMGVNVTGTATNEADIAATKRQLEVQAESNAVKAEAIPIIQEEAVVLTELSDITDGYSGTLLQNIAIQLENETALNANKIQQKQIRAAILETGAATDAQNVKLIQLREEELMLANTIQKGSGVIRQQIRDVGAVGGSIDQLKAKLAGLIVQYEALSVAEKANQMGVQMKRQIDILGPAVLKAESEIAQLSAVTVRSTNSIITGAKTAFSFVRQAAYILPGIGIAGIFNLVFMGIGKVITALHLFGAAEEDSGYKAKTATEQIKEQTDSFAEFNDTILDSTKSAVESGIKLQAYVNIAKDATKPLLERNEALKEANKILGDHAEKLTLVNINTAHMTEEVIRVTQALIEEAVAAKYADKIADLTVKRTYQTQQYSNAVDNLTSAYAFNKQMLEKTGKIDIMGPNSRNIAAYRDQVLQAAKLLNLTSGQIEQLQGEFQAALENSINLFGKTTDKGTKKAKKEIETIEDVWNNLVEKLQQDINNPLLDSMGTAEQEIKDIETAILKLIGMNVPPDSNIIQKLLGMREDLLNPVELQKGLEKLKEYVQQNFKDVDIIIRPKTDEEAAAEALAAHKKFIDQYSKQIKDATDDSGNLIQSQSDIEEKILVERYKKGLINEKEYQEGIKSIQEKAAAEIIVEQIKLAEIIRGLFDQFKQPFEFDKQTAEISKLNLALAKLGYSFDETTGKLIKLGDHSKDVSKLTQALQDAAEVSQNLTQAFTDLTSIDLDNQKAALEEVGAQEDKNYEKEVTNINNSVLTEEQKADKLKILDAQHQARQEEIARKQREYDNQKAEFDRAANIMNIITSTLAAAAKAGFFTPVGIAIEIAGAAALVKALATKIPHYRYGIKSAPEGPALTDEAGAELYEEPSGRMFIGNDYPTIRYLQAGTRVTPASEVNEIIHRSQLVHTAAILREPQKRDDSADRIIKAIVMLSKRKNVIHNHNHIGKEAAFAVWVNKNVRGQ